MQWGCGIGVQPDLLLMSHKVLSIMFARHCRVFVGTMQIHQGQSSPSFNLNNIMGAPLIFNIFF